MESLAAVLKDEQSSQAQIVNALEAARHAVARGAPPDAVCVEAMRPDASDEVCFAASACTANVLIAGGKGVLERGGLERAVAYMRQERPVLAYVACAKIVHVLVATEDVAVEEEILSTALAWAVRAPHERLAAELLCALYALFAKEKATPSRLVRHCLLRIFAATTSSSHDLKLKALNVVVLLPEPLPIDYKILVRILEIQAQRWVLEDLRRDIIPVLHCLTRALPDARVKSAIFPPEADAVWQARIAEEDKETYDRERVHPVDAPPFALRTLLFDLMTDSDPLAKRFSTEFLYELCGADRKEFALRCGVGNAIFRLNF